ncbi:MAG: hypothetical protein WD598_08345 [Acidimicrobiia bacterium]
MTTTETDAPPEEPGEQPPADPSAAGGSGDGSPPELEAPSPARNEPLWTRGILPLALPILAAVAMAVWVINLSRAFLVGGKEGALVIVMVVTLTIMAGASLMSAASRIRTGTSVMLVAALLMTIVTAGIITLGPSEDHGEGEVASYQEPKGKPVAELAVVALASIKFDKDAYTVTPAGITEVVYSGAPGHTLLIEDQKFAGFILTSDRPDSLKAELDPGEYTIYCNVPGHRSTMHAAVTVE